MVVEALAAVGLAGNIAQFLDVLTRLIRGTHEIYTSADGSTRENSQLDEISDYVLTLSSRLESDIESKLKRSRAEQELIVLARRSKDEADKLRLKLSKVKLSPGESKMGSLVQSFKCVWKSTEFKAMAKEVDTCRKLLANQILDLIREDTSTILKALRNLKDEAKETDRVRQTQFQALADDLHSIHSIKLRGDSKPDELESKVASSDFAILKDVLEGVVETAARMRKEQLILAHLTFEQIKARYSRLPEAHARSFSWIFRERTETDEYSPKPKTGFTEWLKGPNLNDHFYWISGKAGSGKSTLMKYICEHPDTAEHLLLWAGHYQLLTASFFFWDSGREAEVGSLLQQSQEGLLRTLLFEILSKCPKLISKTLPLRWEREHQLPWTVLELLQVFRTLGNNLDSSCRFCFFIDGLDEYKGEPSDLLDVVSRLANCENVKVCISSRPWPVFKAAFESLAHRRLFVHDLTSDDIAAYVHDRLESNSLFVRAKCEDSRYQALVDEIVERAQGVFLWVSLVVRSLLNGITNADTIPILQRRLRALPTRLQSFFQHMLDSIDDVYQVQMAQTFQVATGGQTQLPLFLYYMIDELDEDPRYTINLPAQTPGILPKRGHNGSDLTSLPEEIILAEQKMATRLEARCKGLLEVSTHSGHNRFPLKKVDFLHRTVKDFLKSKKISEELQEKSGDHFQPDSAICRAFLGVIKQLPFEADEHQDRGYLLSLIDDFLYYARRSEENTADLIHEAIRELERNLISRYPARDRTHWASKRPHVERIHGVLLQSAKANSVFELCVQYGLIAYVKRRIAEDPSLLTRVWRKPLLSHADHPSITTKYPTVDSKRMVQLLVQCQPEVTDADSHIQADAIDATVTSETDGFHCL
ncbi:hypothetical protein NA57DRAFT_74258 [Rhizodiscina lignyota]|uniref:NACHT domain-containing protein n=1 Tax=Rhizodiscina lignyota TaxID=1504668 RepID=A0A9P4IK01_9PEZI|nr:hypothetical protein NA57DRAFT_74258 [Rhizodiscina lignyota]